MSQIRTRSLIVTTLSGIGIALLFYLAFHYWNEFLVLIENADVSGLIFSLSLLTISNASAGPMFAILLSGPDTTKPDKIRMTSAFLLAQAGKYIPGRVWSIVLQYMAIGHNNPTSLIIANIQLTLSLLVATTGIGLSVIIAKHDQPWLAIAAFMATCVIAYRAATTDVIRPIASLFRLQSLHAQVLSAPNPTKNETEYFFWISIYILTYTLGWFLLFYWAFNMNLEDSLSYLMIVATAQIVGIFSLLPAGIGIREAVFLLMGNWMGFDMGHVISLTLTARLLAIATDLFTILSGSLLAFKQKHSTSP